MGANFLFDKMLPTSAEQGKAGDKRQLEVFRNGGKLRIRMGPLNQENAESDRYTVEVPSRDLELLLAALQPT